jgi:hypothetical protein
MRLQIIKYPDEQHGWRIALTKSLYNFLHQSS